MPSTYSLTVKRHPRIFCERSEQKYQRDVWCAAGISHTVYRICLFWTREVMQGGRFRIVLPLSDRSEVRNDDES